VKDAGAVNIIYGSETGLTVGGGSTGIARNQFWHQDTPGVLDGVSNAGMVHVLRGTSGGADRIERSVVVSGHGSQLRYPRAADRRQVRVIAIDVELREPCTTLRQRSASAGSRPSGSRQAEERSERTRHPRRGFDALHDLATIEGVDRFAIGIYDLALDLGLLVVADPDDVELIWQRRGELVLKSRQLKLPTPIDGV
jgi:hypothetical protein